MIVGPYTLPGLLDLLPNEILLSIMSHHPQTWYHLYRFYPRVKPLHLQYDWARVYVGLFKEMRQNIDHIVFESRIFGQLHSFDDQPAHINIIGDKLWFYNGILHRDGDLPAIVSSQCGRHWYSYGIRHRDNDQPAIIYPDGSKLWYKNGQKYR